MYSYTRLPNFVVDDYLDDLSPHELKVYIYILRRTEGFQKETDQIPLSQFMYGIVTKAGKRLDKGVGLKRRQVL